jgi:hypothetical protein
LRQVRINGLDPFMKRWLRFRTLTLSSFRPELLELHTFAPGVGSAALIPQTSLLLVSTVQS